MKNRDLRIAHLAALALLCALALVAPVAGASSGEDLEILPDPVHLIILIAFFLLLVHPMNKWIFQPIFKVLEEREAKTAGTRKQADRLFAEAEELLGSYESRVRQVRQEAEADRKRILEGARAEGGSCASNARREAEHEVGRAREEVAAALDQARLQLRAQSQLLAREVAERALGRRLS